MFVSTASLRVNTVSRIEECAWWDDEGVVLFPDAVGWSNARRCFPGVDEEPFCA